MLPSLKLRSTGRCRTGAPGGAPRKIRRRRVACSLIQPHVVSQVAAWVDPSSASPLAAKLENLSAIEYTLEPMPTSVHIPKPLLEAVDRRAKVLKISRNRLIVRALEREVRGGGGWSEGFFDRLAGVEAGTVTAADEMLSQIRSSRSSKAPREL